jgi:hypothetical protein
MIARLYLWLFPWSYSENGFKRWHKLSGECEVSYSQCLYPYKPIWERFSWGDK